MAAAVAAVVCWLGAVLALMMTSVVPTQPNGALSQLLLSIIFRTALPFGAGVLISASGGALADAGAFGLIVAFYLVTLATETTLSVGLINRAAEVPKAS